ncbi:MAG: Ig-like domain-containing protein [Maribacter sp.]|nr:Ig-like domain-containing protein [Maribacter sp.]
MKSKKNGYLKTTLLLGFIFTVVTSCEREISDNVEFATFPKNAEVFIDGFSGGLQYFPFLGSKFDAFSVDTEVKYKGEASMRLDVPNFGDPSGAYAGAIFPDATGRNLSDYDALTFWAKSSQAATINEIGFGNDFGENKYLVTKANLRISTNWSKYVIPLPDPYKLTLEKGMFWYAEGPENNDGYTIWIDEIQYEKLGTIAQPSPAIFNGVDRLEQAFVGANLTMNGLTQTFNLASGINETVSVAPSYFKFSSTDVDVARVSELGVVSIVGIGTAKITAVLGDVRAKGSLTIESLGSFVAAPTPTRSPSDVISIFSNAYTNVPVEYYNGYYAPYQTTQGQDDLNINGDNIIKYTELNFVGIQFSQPTINATAMTHLHIDVLIQEPNPIDGGDFLKIELEDYGADGTFGNGDDSAYALTFTSPTLVSGSWVSLDIPLSDFTGLTSTANLGQILFISDATITEILVDNIYLYR